MRGLKMHIGEFFSRAIAVSILAQLRLHISIQIEGIVQITEFHDSEKLDFRGRNTGCRCHVPPSPRGVDLKNLAAIFSNGLPGLGAALSVLSPAGMDSWIVENTFQEIEVDTSAEELYFPLCDMVEAGSYLSHIMLY